MDFSEKIRNLRIQNNMTQEEFAEKVMVSRTAVSKWETGSGYPSLESLMIISEGFNVSIDGLLSKEDVQRKTQLEKSRRNQATIYSVIISILIIFVIRAVTLYGTSEKDIAKTLYFHLKNLNYQMIETSEMIDFAYNEGAVDYEMFEAVCKNLYMHCWETSKAIDEIADFRKDQYKNYEVFYIGDWASEIWFKVRSGAERLSDDEIKEIYSSIKLICDGWSELDWKGIGGYEEYDFKNDPGNMAEHIAAVTELADEEYYKLIHGYERKDD